MSNYIGEVFESGSGQWSFRITHEGIEIADGAGFPNALEADRALAVILASYSPDDQD